MGRTGRAPKRSPREGESTLDLRRPRILALGQSVARGR